MEKCKTDNKGRQQDTYCQTRTISFNSILLAGLILHSATLQKFSVLSVFYWHTLPFFTDETQIVSPWDMAATQTPLLAFQFCTHPLLHQPTSVCYAILQSCLLCFSCQGTVIFPHTVFCPAVLPCCAYSSQKVKNRKRGNDIMPNLIIVDCVGVCMGLICKVFQLILASITQDVMNLP